MAERSEGDPPGGPASPPNQDHNHENKPKNDQVHDEENDQAIDESSDVDGDFASLQKMLSQKRRAAKDCPKSRLQKAFPFFFSPHIRPLTISDRDSCIALENAAFPHPEHRASPEKFEYRLTTCSELCLGLFCTVVPSEAGEWSVETLAHAKLVETNRHNGAVSVLLAHIVATRCRGDVITDADMDYPSDWRSRKGRPADVGHQDEGRTVAVHSFAVLPRLHGCGIGKMLMRAYLQQMNNSGLASRVVLICQESLVSYYERSGFTHLGESKATFGGGGWHDMACDLPGLKPFTPYSEEEN